MIEKSNLKAEHLKNIVKLPDDESIMSKFLKDNKNQMEQLTAEMQQNMPLAMSFYNKKETGEPYLFRRISMTSTIKSVYFDSEHTNSTPTSTPDDSIEHDMQILISMGLSGKINFNMILAGDSGLGKSTFIQTYLALKFLDVQSDLLKSDESTYSPTSEITHNKGVWTEDNLTLCIDLVDTPGYGIFKDIKGYISLINRFLRVQIINYYK